jgi:hypothetical protein
VLATRGLELAIYSVHWRDPKIGFFSEGGVRLWREDGRKKKKSHNCGVSGAGQQDRLKRAGSVSAL